MGSEMCIRDSCDREMRAGGVHHPRGERAPRVLTSQESAVVELVVQGRSNKDVAAELQISPKTVQYQLTRVYGKYGVRSRTELARRHPDEQSPTDRVRSDHGGTGSPEPDQ